MIDIESVRSEVDKVDRDMLALFLRRLALVDEIAASKRERGASVEDPAREREILARVAGDAPPRFASAATAFFESVFSISKARQRSILGESRK